MTNTNCTTAKRRFKYLTDIQRGRLEELTRQGIHTQAEMAEMIGVSQSTIQSSRQPYG